MTECLLPATGAAADSVLIIAAAVMLAGVVALWIGRRRHLPTVLVALVATGTALSVAGPAAASGPPCTTTTVPSVARQASSSGGADPTTPSSLSTSDPVVGGTSPQSTTSTTNSTSTTMPAPTDPTIAAPSPSTTTTANTPATPVPTDPALAAPSPSTTTAATASTTPVPIDPAIAAPPTSTTTTTTATTTTNPVTIVTMPNQPPIIGADSVVVLKNTPWVMGNVLTNDIDPDGDPLHVVNIGSRTTPEGQFSVVLYTDGSYLLTVDVDHPDLVLMPSGESRVFSVPLIVSDGHNRVVTTIRVEIQGFDEPEEDDEEEECDLDMGVLFPDQCVTGGF